MEQRRAQRLRVRGLVFGFNRGGFDVLVDGLRAFCPATGMALGAITDPHQFLGGTFEFSLPQKRRGKAIVISRRGILEREARKIAKEKMKTLSVGDKLSGTISRIRDYGVLVDTGDHLEGLVHLSELSWSRGIRPADAFKVGEAVTAEVVKIQVPSRKDRFGKLSLSIKKCLPDPWETQAQLLELGKPIKGKIVSLTEFGAFVELAPGVEGLVHISELGGKNVKHAKQVAKLGDELDVVVERADKKERKISLSKLSDDDLKAVAEGTFDPATRPKSLARGSRVKVVIQRVEHSGLQVQVKGVLGKRGRGFVSNRDFGEVSDRKALSQGAEIEVKIVGVERGGGLKCSIKHLHFDDEREAVKEYRKQAASQGFGTFGDLLKAKLEGASDSVK